MVHLIFDSKQKVNFSCSLNNTNSKITIRVTFYFLSIFFAEFFGKVFILIVKWKMDCDKF